MRSGATARARHSLIGVLLLAVCAATVALGSLGCAQQCPAGLIEGVLTAQGDDLVVVQPSGVISRVDWAASGHRISDDPDRMSVRNRLNQVEAREGDFVRLGGGEQDGRWQVCNTFEVSEP